MEVYVSAGSSKHFNILNFNYKYFPTSSFHILDVDIPGVDFPGVGGIAEEDVDCPLPVRGEQLLGLLLHLVTASRPDLGSRAAVATRAVQPTNSRKWDVCKVTS